jgi:hypothetical protein
MERQIDKGTLSIINFGIELRYIQQMYHQSSGMFYFPQFERRELHNLHGIALGIQSFSDSIFKCEPMPGKLFTIQITNHYGGPPDWVAQQERSKASESTTIELA